MPVEDVVKLSDHWPVAPPAGETALKLSPDFAPAHFQLALALRQKGEAAQASVEFEKAHELDPHLRPPQVATDPSSARPDKALPDAHQAPQ